jgi:two-component system chemotaxis response regulator CheY
MAEANKCLVVDDSPIIRRILGVMLSRLGFAVIEAGSVQAALSLCEESHPDLVVVDWNLPDEDGVTLVQQLRRLPGGERMKLILCTVERSVTHIETALSAGADEYITKPFGIEVLETKLGYLGFDVSTQIASPTARRHVSRVGFTGMAAAEAEEAFFAAGQTIFAEGETPDFAYILLDGEVKIRCVAASGRVLDFVQTPFDLIGELSLTDAAPRRATATALTDCSLMRVSRANFQAELAQLSPFMRNWVESLGDRMGELTDRLLDDFETK